MSECVAGIFYLFLSNRSFQNFADLMAGEMAEHFGALSALVEVLSSVPSTRVRQLTVACNSSSRGGSDTFSGPPWTPELKCTPNTG